MTKLTDEERTARDESVALMRQVAGRCLNAEKLSFTLAHAMRKRPNEKAALNLLSGLLQEYLADTGSMVHTIPYLLLINGEKKAGKDEAKDE